MDSHEPIQDPGAGPTQDRTHDLAPGSVVVAVDGSTHADRAVDWAAAQAALEGRRLDLVHVLEDQETRSAVWASAGGATPGGLARARATAGASLEEVAARVRGAHPDLEVHAHVLDGGDPRTLLVEVSRTAHLVVLGSRGRGPVASLLLGSVSTAVTLHAACPVVVARPPSGDRRGPGEGVVVGADGSVDSLPVIEFAFRQASLRALPLTVVHYYQDVLVGAGFDVAVLEVDVEDMRVVLAQSVAGMGEKFPDVAATTRLQRGATDPAFTGDDAWDLIVVGRRTKSAWDRVLVGSVGRAVLEHATTTVAVVPEPAVPGR